MTEGTMATRITYLISHGHTARGALQTNLLQLLRQEGIEVTVIAREGKDSEFSSLISEQGARLVSYSPKQDRWRHHLSNFRGYIHQDIRENPALWEKHLQKTDPAIAGRRKITITKLYLVVGDLIRKTGWLKQLFKKLEQRSYTKNQAIELVRELKPDLVISTRPVDDLEVEILRAAEVLGVERAMYILSWDNITSKGFFPVLANYYLTWGPVMNEELDEYYQVSSSRIFNTGVTHFDIHARVKMGEIESPGLLDKIGLDPTRPYLFFTMSASYYAPNEIDIIEALALKVVDGYFGDDMQLIIRPHMINLMSDRSDQSWLKRLQELQSERVKVDFPDAHNSLLTWYMKQDDMIRLSHLINGAAVCLNSGSTIAIEAVYLDRPVVLTPFDTEEWSYWRSARRLIDYLHLEKIVATGACSVASSLDEMFRYVADYLADPTLLQARRTKAVERECYRNDGLSTQRFVENVKRILYA